MIRAEASAADKMGALDLALDKMASQMRRASDRRRVHHGRNTPVSVGQALADTRPWPPPRRRSVTTTERHVGPIAVTGDGPLVVREKTHPATPDDPRPGPLRDGARWATTSTCSSTRRASDPPSSTGVAGTTTA